MPQPSKTDALDVIAWVDPPLLLSRGIKGRSYDVTIGGRRVTLTLPSEGLKGIDMSRPESRQPVPRFPPPPLAKAITSGVHIAVSSRRGVSDPVFAVGAVRLRWQGDEHREPFAMSAFSEDLGVWLGIVRSWLAAWSGNLHTAAYIDPTPRTRAAVIDHPERGPVGGGSGETSVFMLGLRTSTATHLRAAFAAASRSEAIPLERQLLAEARLDAARDRYRHAVINACTAAEVALSDAARVSLSRAGRAPKEVDKILKGVSGVVDLYRLNAHRPQGLGVSIGHVSDQLAGPRNAAAHAGESLDEDTARKALQTARKLLDAVAPVPTSQSLLKRQSTRSRAP